MLLVWEELGDGRWELGDGSWEFGVWRLGDYKYSIQNPKSKIQNPLLLLLWLRFWFDFSFFDEYFVDQSGGIGAGGILSWFEQICGFILDCQSGSYCGCHFFSGIFGHFLSIGKLAQYGIRTASYGEIQSFGKRYLQLITGNHLVGSEFSWLIASHKSQLNGFIDSFFAGIIARNILEIGCCCGNWFVGKCAIEHLSIFASSNLFHRIEFTRTKII